MAKPYYKLPSSKLAAFYLGRNESTGKFHWQHMAPDRMLQIFEHIKNDELLSGHAMQIKKAIETLKNGNTNFGNANIGDTANGASK
jgi:hypothetical protein